MNTRKNILIFIDWFYPGFLAGGPVQSITSIVENLNTEFNFKIITTNCDLNSSEPYPEIISNCWTHSPLNCEVYYADKKNLNYRFILKLMKETSFDLVYINSFFSINFSIIPLRILNAHFSTIPIVFAPRGMLGEGALAIKSIKKKLFIQYSKFVKLHENVIWHATSSQEVSEIEKVINPKSEIQNISNLPKRIGRNRVKAKIENELNLCFISRISEKKNLIYALSVLNKLDAYQIRYRIYGPIEDQAYWAKCKEIINGLPKNVNVSYEGNLKPTDIEKALSTEHVMFLPTLNENFGHSIVESLLCGCPVIISDQTPWNDLANFDAGFALELNTPEKFKTAIIHYAKLNQEEFNEASSNAINYISKKINLEEIVQQYKQLFNDSIKNRSINL